MIMNNKKSKSKQRRVLTGFHTTIKHYFLTVCRNRSRGRSTNNHLIELEARISKNSIHILKRNWSVKSYLERKQLKRSSRRFDNIFYCSQSSMIFMHLDARKEYYKPTSQPQKTVCLQQDMT